MRIAVDVRIFAMIFFLLLIVNSLLNLRVMDVNMLCVIIFTSSMMYVKYMYKSKILQIAINHR